MKQFKTLAPYIKKTWHKFVISFSLLLLVDLLQVWIPWIIRGAIDSISSPDFSENKLITPVLLIISLAIMMGILRFSWRTLLIGNSFYIEKLLREKLYTHLMTLSQRFFNYSKTGELMAHATNDVGTVRDFIGWGFLSGVDMVLVTIVSFSFMFYINVQLTLIAMIPLPILAFMIWYTGEKINQRFEIVQKSFAEMSGMVNESVSGIRVIKSFSQEETELEKLTLLSKSYVSKNLDFIKLIAIFHPGTYCLISISILMVVVFGGRAVVLGDISIGSFVAFFTYLGMLIWPMFGIGWFIEMYQSSSASMKRINVILDKKAEIDDSEYVCDDIDEIRGQVEVRGLWFGDAVLKNISFSLLKGETLAICGRTGCGKSTLLDLLCRVYNPMKDTIFIDENDINTIPLKLLRESVVMVPQDVFILSDSIANNIALGKPNASIQEIHNAAKFAAIYDEIIDFPNGFDTIIGEKGVTISGGQKQRIAIARALLVDPKILILDDALSAVDTKTEKNILHNFSELRKNKTNIIVAHRLSALTHANRIIVLDDGAIIEEGTHQELLEKKGLYFDLFQKQQLEEDE